MSVRRDAFKQIQTIELIGAFVNLEQFRVPEHFLDLVVLAQTGLSHELHGHVAVLDPGVGAG
jgi:hypothetical protein